MLLTGVQDDFAGRLLRGNLQPEIFRFAVAVEAGASVAVQGLGVALLARKDLSKDTTVSGATTTMPSTENLVQARVLAEGDIAILASGTGAEQGHIFMTGAKLEANNGHVSLLAARNADITHDITTDRNYERFYEVKRSWFSKRVTDITTTTVDETANPSDISGRSVSVGAGGAINVVGSLLAADGAVGLHADQDVNLLATSEAHLAYESRSVRKSGIFGNGGLSITIGSKSSLNVTSSQETRQASSSIVSLAGDVMATAGGQYLQMSSDIVAPQGDVHIAAQNITLQSNNNTRSVLNIIRERQSGLTVSLSHPLVSMVQTASEMAKVAKRTENGRYQALALLTAGLSIYNQYRPLNEMAKSLTTGASDAANPGWSISANLGASKTDFESLTSATTPVESSINAGRNVSLTATGTAAETGDINLIGSRVTASENLTLKAQRDITLAAAVGKDTERTKRTSSAASIGLSYGFSGTTQGLAVNLAASRSNAWSNGWGTTFFNSELTAGKVLSVDSGRDWALTGAKASGDTVLARVGSSGEGNLNIVSPRDESFYQAREQSLGFNVSIPIPGAGTGGSLSLNASQLRLLAENESVKQQSAIVAGTGGYDINVNGHTHLVGAAVASKAAAALNRFSTQTLLHEDVANRDVASGKSMSVGVSISVSKNQAGQTSASGGGSNIGFARIDSLETSNTRSSMASGLVITRPDLQAQRAQLMKSAERNPLIGLRSERQAALNELRWSEPPPCDTCAFQSEPGLLNAAPAKAASKEAGGAAGQDTVPTLVAPATVPAADLKAGAGAEYNSNSRWRAWRDAMDALVREIAALDARIAAIDAKVYQGPGHELSRSPSGLHTPLLHTFDRTKATQELRDGVAVTAEFGKAAYKAAGDFALKQYIAEQKKCSDVNNCPEAERWNDGGRYKVLLHAIIGGLAYGKPGAISGSAVELAGPVIKDMLLAANVTEGSAAYEWLTLVSRTLVGAAASGAPGAAIAYNATANNYLQHYKDIRKAKVQQVLKNWAECSPASCPDIVFRVEKYLRENLSEAAISQKCGTDNTCVAEGREARQKFESVRDQAVQGLSPDAGALRFMDLHGSSSGYSRLDLLASVKRMQDKVLMDPSNPVDVYVFNTLRNNPGLFAAITGVAIFDQDGLGGGGTRRGSSTNAAQREGATAAAAAPASNALNIVGRELTGAEVSRAMDMMVAARDSFPNSRTRREGTIAVAEIEVSGLPKSMAASSQMNVPAGSGLLPVGSGNFSYDPAVPSQDGRPTDGKTHAEYRILDNIADKLGNNPAATGRVNLVVEINACDSCRKAIDEFRAKYPKVELNVAHITDRVRPTRRGP